MKATSYISILILAMAMPLQMRSQQVLVNVGNQHSDSVTVTVTVMMPKSASTDTTATTTTTTTSVPIATTMPAAPDTLSSTPADTLVTNPIASHQNIPQATSADEPILGLSVPLPQTAERHSNPVVRKNTLTGIRPEMQERVIVKGDTVPLVIPTKNYGRYDRGLFNYLYIVKGCWQFGLSASYGEFSTEDVQVLSLLKDVDFNGKLYALKPWVSYAIHNNQTIGLRLNYTKGMADLGSLSVDIDDDMDFDLRNVSYYSQSYSLGVFYRNYVGLNRSKRFAVFNEVSLEFSSGSSRFKRSYDDVLYDTRTISRGGNLNFSPGVCVFIQENVAFNVSFGVFGIKFNKDTQTTNGQDDGSRFSSGANFKFNIFNINFGLMVVI